jgi:L-threonylcarbamoyladenylate synthase
LKTRLFNISEEEKLENNNKIKEAAKMLRNGLRVVFPTETVYGIGANALDEKSVKKIFEVKGRPSDNPLIVHISSLKDIEQYAVNISDKSLKLIDVFFPGPLTLIMEKAEKIPYAVTAGLETVAIRMPKHPVARAFIKECGVPVAAPSANISGKPSPTELEHVLDDMSDRVEGIISSRGSQYGLESTVIDMTIEPPCLLRPGNVTIDEIEQVIGAIDVSESVFSEKISSAVASPGMKYRHYAPKASLYIVKGSQIPDKIRELILKYSGKKVGVLTANNQQLYNKADVVLSLGDQENLEEMGRQLFKKLREFDRKNVDIIFAEDLSDEGIGLAITNRLYKASGFRFINSDKGEKMKIALGCDHGGYELKEIIKKWLLEKKEIDVVDYGTNSSESVDYPAYGHIVAKAVVNNECDKGIVICGTGLGISISANKIKGARAALCTNEFMAKMARAHNNANILALGARVVGSGLALSIAEAFLESEFEGGRHERRVNQIECID